MEKNEGYTLVEMLITVVILGFILLLVNVVLISIIKVAYNTDAKIKVRQGIEFTIEAIDRDVKSANPDSVIGSGELLTVDLTESGQQVQFTREVVNNIGVAKATWGEGPSAKIVYLTSPSQINVKSMNFTVQNDPDTGTRIVNVQITADSVKKNSNGTPVIQNFLKEAAIVTSKTEN